MKRAAMFLLCQATTGALVALLFAVSAGNEQLWPAVWPAVIVAVAANIAEVRMNRRTKPRRTRSW